MDPTAEARFTQIYETHYVAVLAYCVRRVNRADAEEVTNDVFSVLWKRMDSFDTESPLPWLYRVAYGSIGNRRRTLRRRAALRAKLSGLRDIVDSPDVIVVQQEQDRETIAALHRLRPADQEVLTLSIWEDLSAREIGLVVGCSTSAAEQRIHRAKNRLARELSSVAHRTMPSHTSLEGGGRP
ncbi:MAG: RNA polymerase sigma factor [Acidimicrobiia bacterium]